MYLVFVVEGLFTEAELGTKPSTRGVQMQAGE